MWPVWIGNTLYVDRADRRCSYFLVLMGLAKWLPTLFPLLLVIYLLVRPSRQTLGYALLYFGYSFGIFAHFNKRYLRGASPWCKAWWVPVMQVVFPVQLLVALLSPQRINWRGNIVQVERGGGFCYVRRRAEQASFPTRKFIKGLVSS